MFYCEDCRVKNAWPTAFTTSVGKCECCDKLSMICYDRPSSSLPLPKTPAAAPADAPTVDGLYKEPDWPFEATDLVIGTFRAPTDGGGFSMNRVETGVKIVHKPSGLVAIHAEDHSQHRNKLEAMRKLAELVRAWQAGGSPAPRPTAEQTAAALEVITRALAPAQKTGLAVLPEDALETLGHVREALTEYYEDLYQRKHGGVAMSHALAKIEQIFAMNYDAYRNQKGE